LNCNLKRLILFLLKIFEMKTEFSGPLLKMRFRNDGQENLIKPSYILLSNSSEFVLNNALGKTIKIVFSGKITCVSCGKVTKKSFGQGFCYPCFISVPQTEECVLRPELCQAHLGFARDMDYAKNNCLVSQYVYLALSGGLKVGVTRFHQIPDRWVDQGASKAIKLAIAENRYTAGIIEIALKKVMADKTNWRKMLMGNDEDISLIPEKQRALEYLINQGFEITVPDDTEYSISYPVLHFPTKVNSKDLLKEPILTGNLIGVKGQYLLFNDGMVINLRKHSGFNVDIFVE
jgi:hypothetical protein